jgi:hypothetical protein
MSDDWLEISDENINVEEIMRQIRERIARRSGIPPSEEAERPEDVVEALWRERIGDIEETVFSKRVPIRLHDCDVVPRYYVIDWRIPILGPVHAVVRRIINAEIRRYLLPSLEKQSSFNRKVMRALRDLVQENIHLRQEIGELRERLK